MVVPEGMSVRFEELALTLNCKVGIGMYVHCKYIYQCVHRDNGMFHYETTPGTLGPVVACL